MLRKLIYLLSCYESDLTLFTRFLRNKARLSCLEIFQRFIAFWNVRWYHEQALSDGGCWNWFQMGVGFSGPYPPFPYLFERRENQTLIVKSVEVIR